MPFIRTPAMYQQKYAHLLIFYVRNGIAGSTSHHRSQSGSIALPDG
nr:Uncharacterised protein [Salmonella sp. NCTC 7297]